MPTENRDYNLPEAGEDDWHVPVNENWELIDQDVQKALDKAAQALEAATGDGGDDTDDGTQPSAGTGFTWDETHTDTSWVTDADEEGTLNVETVTSLDVDGPGSITEAVEAGGSDPTLVVFEVGGVIDIGGGPYWRLEQPNTYIAGQTAPYPGISMIRGGTRVQADNVIIEHVGFYPGDDVDEPHKARAVTHNDGNDDILFNHCTAAWAPDTNINMRDDSVGHAFINGICSEALNDSSHPEAPHGYGFLAREGCQQATFMGNLMSHNWKRHIKPNENTHLAFINNYVWNWGDRVWHGSEPSSEVDWRNSVVEAGPDTDLNSLFSDTPGVVYFDDNTLIPSDMPLGDDEIDYVDSPMYTPAGLDSPIPPGDLESFLVDNAGPRPADRAPQEKRIVNDFSNRSGRIIDHHSEVGGYQDYATQTRSLDPPGTGVLDWLQQYTTEVGGS